MNAEEIEVCIEKYGTDIYRFCCFLTGSRTLADDLYQDTFLKALEIDKTIAVEEAKKYLIGITANLWRNQWRKEKRRQKIAPSHVLTEEDLSDSPSEYSEAASPDLLTSCINRETSALLRTAIHDLPEKYRVIVLMYYSVDLSTKEIPVSVYMDFDSSSESTIHKTMSDSKQTGSGELSVIVAGKRLTRDKMFTVHLQPSLVFHAGSENTTVCNASTLTLHVTDKSTVQSSDYRISPGEAAKLSDTLIQQIKGITLKSTEVGTYLTVTYESTGSSDDATGTFIDLCDKNGNVIPGNVIAGGTCKENGDHSFTCKNGYENIGLPEEIYLSIGDGKQILKAEKTGETHGKRG